MSFDKNRYQLYFNDSYVQMMMLINEMGLYKEFLKITLKNHYEFMVLVRANTLVKEFVTKE